MNSAIFSHQKLPVHPPWRHASAGTRASMLWLGNVRSHLCCHQQQRWSLLRRPCRGKIGGRSAAGGCRSRSSSYGIIVTLIAGVANCNNRRLSTNRNTSNSFRLFLVFLCLFLFLLLLLLLLWLFLLLLLSFMLFLLSLMFLITSLAFLCLVVAAAVRCVCVCVPVWVCQ